MRHPKPESTKPHRKFRLNISISEASRVALKRIAEREDRKPGYLAVWFLEWGIRQYEKTQASLVQLKDCDLNPAVLEGHAKQRLALREEAQRKYEGFSEPAAREKKRA